jgi:hypothetical protein
MAIQHKVRSRERLDKIEGYLGRRELKKARLEIAEADARLWGPTDPDDDPDDFLRSELEIVRDEIAQADARLFEQVRANLSVVHRPRFYSADQIKPTISPLLSSTLDDIDYGQKRKRDSRNVIGVPKVRRIADPTSSGA